MKRAISPLVDFGDVYAEYKNYPEPEGRTKKILEFVKDKMPSPRLVLDIGSGNGSGVTTLGNFFPAAEIYGYEPRISNERWSGRKFDLITLFHVLEHVEDLREMLAYIKLSLANNGHVLIQVPYTVMGPFDLVVADHVWHFTIGSLIRLFDEFQFSIPWIDNNVLKKEITLLASLDGTGTRSFGKSPAQAILPDIRQLKVMESINWILNYKKLLDSVCGPVAVYGTGPAAAWAGNILGDKVEFYIDDDPKRAGEFNGKPARPPCSGSIPVVAPFSDYQLENIKNKNPDLRFVW